MDLQTLTWINTLALLIVGLFLIVGQTTTVAILWAMRRESGIAEQRLAAMLEAITNALKR